MQNRFKELAGDNCYISRLNGNAMTMRGILDLIPDICFWPAFFLKKNLHEVKTSHQTNENFTIKTQFPFASFIIGIFQNLYDKKLS